MNWMKSWKKPTPDQIDRAVVLLTHGEQHRHFFDRLENPEWLVPLKEKGFFSSPPPPVPDESGRNVGFPAWPESRYLARMAKLAPETVVDILTSIPDTENIRVHDDFADAALALPAKLAAIFVSKAINWLRLRFQLFFPEKLGALVGHLASGGEVGPALELAKAILTIRADPRKSEKVTEENRFLFPEPQPLFDLWDYGKILNRDIPNLVAAAEAPALKLLCDLLDDAVRLSQRADEGQGPDDYSYIWRPAIDHPRHTVDDDVRGMLVSAVRGAAEQAAQQNPASVPEIIRNLENRKWRVFHRIALHVLRLFARAAPDLVAERLREPERFDRSDFHREYNLLAKEHFAQLGPEDQAKILDRIQKGPDIEAFRAGWERFRGSPVTDQEAAAYFKAWQRDRLAPISADLPEDWKQRYAELVSEIGPARDREDAVSATWGGSSSPKTAEDLRTMTIDELVGYFRSWVPSGNPFGNTIAGLGHAVGTLVASEPERFSDEADRFEGLDPTYVRALLQALWEPVKQKRSINWDKVLTLCHWVVDQPRTIPGREGRITDQDPDWGWTRKAIANLLTQGFGSEGMPFEARPQAWRILEVLSDDPDPTPEDESQHGPNYEPAEYSINTTRGEAIHAVIGYALWVRRHTEKESEDKSRAAQGFDQMPEVRTVLDKHLDPNAEPSFAIRSVYGQWFPSLVFLDPNWARASTPRIFPDYEASKDLRDAAWKTYIVYCAPYDDVFELLKEQYHQAIERIEIPIDNGANRRAPDLRLAQHLMTEYWRGNLAEDDPDGLLAHFYAKADPKLCYWALDFVGTSLRNTQGAIPAEILQRLQKLWATRLEVVRAAGPSFPQKEELTAFGWWFASKKFPDGWSIDQVLEVLRIAGSIEPDHLVVERLAELSALMTAKAVECLALIVEGDKDGWAVLSWREHARNLLGGAIHSADQTARMRAINLVHYLGARGYSEFRDLIPANVAG